MTDSTGPAAVPLPHPPAYFIDRLLRLGRLLRDTVISARNRNSAFSGVSKNTSADTIYEVDAHVEPVLEAFCKDWARELPMILIAEGLQDQYGREGHLVLPLGTPESAAAIRLIIDPIDGTRGLMYDKRSAWVLAGVAPNRGPSTRLSDIQIAVQVEIPTSKQTLADVLWAARGQGAHAQRDNLITGTHATLPITPSTADNLTHGFASVANFFPGIKDLAAELMERIAAQLLGPADASRAAIFDDQYISSGGQFYELIVGHDRATIDIRPLFYQIKNLGVGLCVHPYDVAAALIATEAGIIVTNGRGGPLDGPLDTETSISFAAFANPALRGKIEPVVLTFLREKGLV